MFDIRKIYNGLLFVTISWQVYANSVSNGVQGNILKYIQYILWALMLLLFMYVLFLKGLSQRGWAALLVFFLISIIACFFKDYVFIPFFIFGVYGIYISGQQIIKIYSYSMLVVVVSTVLLSLVGRFPMYTESNLLSMGFSNPNVLGFLITTIFIGFLITYNVPFVESLIIATLICLFDYICLGDNTAFTITIIFFALSFGKSDQFTLSLKEIVVCMPVALFILSWFLACFYGKYNWIYEISSFLTGRPAIWNAYKDIYTIHLFPQHIQIYTLSSYQYAFFGENLPLIYRGFDGAYIYLLLSQGILITALILYSLTYYVIHLNAKKQKKELYMMASMLIFAVTESIVIAPFGYFESYLVILIIRKLILGTRKTRYL